MDIIDFLLLSLLASMGIFALIGVVGELILKKVFTKTKPRGATRRKVK